MVDEDDGGRLWMVMMIVKPRKGGGTDADWMDKNWRRFWAFIST